MLKYHLSKKERNLEWIFERNGMMKMKIRSASIE
jgi:hypothetical protein